MTTIERPGGGYRFLPGIAPYSKGVVASPGFEIVRVAFQRPLPWREGLERVAGILAARGRPRTSLCAVELRSPSPFTFDGFAEFNAGYSEVLKEWGLFVDGENPVARTNVAPEVRPPAGPSVYAFSHARPAGEPTAPPTFVVAGAGELPEGVLSAGGVVAPGDTSAEGLLAKASFVIGLMEERLLGLGARWEDVTAVDAYTVHPLHGLLTRALLPKLGPAALLGLNWHYSRPPIAGLEFEMDLRGVRLEYRVD